QGRVTVLNFWGTWCRHCQEEFPHVVALGEKFRRDRRFQLFAVSCSGGDDSDLAALHEETAAFLRQHDFELPTYFDPGETTRLAVQDLLRAPFFAYPTTLVLDEGGIVRGAWTGYRAGDERQVEALVTKLLSSRP
ncbi:MAG TPA: TlpA disulfide reductase family protein, partial [Pirellulales bacterium]|nr:TlpA disulfide reductase family protein [Pirellulales bacterium]